MGFKTNLGENLPQRSPAQGARRVSPLPCITQLGSLRFSPSCTAEATSRAGKHQVFRSASRLLAEHKPAVVCEMHAPESAQTLDELLRRFGYTLKVLDGDRLLPLPT